MTFQVWRLHTYPLGDNQYGVSRAEDWCLKKDQTFEDLEAAQHYIRESSLAHTTLPLYTVDIVNPTAKDQFVDDFCFNDNQYMIHRRYFLQPPHLTKRQILDAIVRAGIVLKN